MIILPSQCTDLSDKNNSIKTGYENFCIKKGPIKLYPFKDFDFIGKHVVCQKCCQKFASVTSYRAHLGTSVCVRTYNGPNLVYLKYKNRHCRRLWKKNKNKSIEDLHHDIKKNLLNPEMLNTLQTRNNCYSDNIIHKRNKVKQRNDFDRSEDPSVKKPRGRPKKHIECEPKKRGRPKKWKIVSSQSTCQDDNNLNNDLESNDSESKNTSSVSICSADDAYNNNVNEIEKLKLLYSKMKLLMEKFWNLANSEWKRDKYADEHQSSNSCFDQISYGEEEKQNDLSLKDKQIFRNIEVLKIDLKLLSKQFQSRNEYSYKEELDLMLSTLNEKHNEYKESKLNKTDKKNGLTSDKGKENMHCAIEAKHETDITVSENISGYDMTIENSVKLWIEQNKNSMMLSHEECLDRNNFKNDLPSDNNFNVKKTPDLETSDNVTNSNCVDSSLLNCKICNNNFASIAEWKMHHSEHMLKNNNFMCKICGHRFKMYKNYIKHVKGHGVLVRERKMDVNKNSSKKLTCKSCGRQYNYLKSYFAHIKTHIK